MPRVDDASDRIITTLFDAAVYQRAIRVRCRCSHTARLNPYALWWLFYRKGWDQRLKVAKERLKCSRCGWKGFVLIDLVGEEWDKTSLPMPPETEWKRAVRRSRG